MMALGDSIIHQPQGQYNPNDAINIDTSCCTKPLGFSYNDGKTYFTSLTEQKKGEGCYTSGGLSGLSTMIDRTMGYNKTNQMCITPGATSSDNDQKQTNVLLDESDLDLWRTLQKQRYKTFSGKWHYCSVSSLALSVAGFIYYGPTDTVICVFCFRIFEKWEKNDDPVECHKQYAPECKFVLEYLKEGSKELPHDGSKTLHHTGEPYAIYGQTLSDPHNNTNTPKETNSRILKNQVTYNAGCNSKEKEEGKMNAGQPNPTDNNYMSPTHDVQTMNTDGSKNSRKIKTRKPENGNGNACDINDNKVDVMKRQESSQKKNQMCSAEGEGPDHDAKPQTKTHESSQEETFMSLPDGNNDKTRKKKQAIKARHQPVASPNKEDILSAKTTFKDKIEEYKTARTCKVCLENTINRAYLPCGHFAFCDECTKHLKECPLCRSPIKALVRVQLVGPRTTKADKTSQQPGGNKDKTCCT